MCLRKVDYSYENKIFVICTYLTLCDAQPLCINPSDLILIQRGHDTTAPYASGTANTLIHDLVIVFIDRIVQFHHL